MKLFSSAQKNGLQVSEKTASVPKRDFKAFCSAFDRRLGRVVFWLIEFALIGLLGVFVYFWACDMFSSPGQCRPDPADKAYLGLLRCLIGSMLLAIIISGFYTNRGWRGALFLFAASIAAPFMFMLFVYAFFPGAHM